MDELSAALKAADADDAIHVIVLGHHGEHFGAGYDLNADWAGRYGAESPLGVRAMLRDCLAFEFTPWDCEKPVIAMVRGYCLAGSCELAMMCCVTYASGTAVFGEPEIRFSTSPPVVVMPWIVGLKKARELLYTGDLIDAAEALRIGMVNHVVADDELEAATLKYARRAASMPAWLPSRPVTPVVTRAWVSRSTPSAATAKPRPPTAPGSKLRRGIRRCSTI